MYNVYVGLKCIQCKLYTQLEYMYTSLWHRNGVYRILPIKKKKIRDMWPCVWFIAIKLLCFTCTCDDKCNFLKKLKELNVVCTHTCRCTCTVHIHKDEEYIF